MDLKKYLQSRHQEMVKLLKELVWRESPSHDKKAVDACTSFLAAVFKKEGLRVTRFPARLIGDLYLVELGPAKAIRRTRPLLILTHADTVWPVGQIRKMPFVIRGGKAFGPGVLDMKAGLVQAFFALQAIKELNLQLQGPVQLFINSAEEIGSPVSSRFINQLARKASAVFCLEPSLPGGALKLQRKGRLVVRLETSGRLAHAGSPGRGLNAIEELMQQLQRLKRLQKAGVTLNIGLIGGGQRANVVPDQAWAVLDFRFWKASDKEQILSGFRSLTPALRGAKVSYSQESLTPPMERTPASRALFSPVKLLAADLGFKLTWGKTGGGSDASLASSLGRPTLDGLGPDGDGLHAENEHVLLPSLIQRTVLLTTILTELPRK